MFVTLTGNSIQWLRDQHIHLNCYLNNERLSAGETLYFEDNLMVEPYIGIYSGHNVCRMGAFSYSNSAVTTDMIVGRYCSISWGLQVPGPRHPMESISTSNFTYTADTALLSTFIASNKPKYNRFLPNTQKPGPIIGHDVWIGQHVSLMPGITIGNGAVIAASSVVTKNVGAYEVVGGNPARVIKKRFDDETIALLLESEWWNYKFTDFAELPIGQAKDFAEDFLKIKAAFVPYTPAKIALANIPR